MADDLASQYYQRHHAGDSGMPRYGFTIGGDERGRWFARRIGAGRKVLDLGCRDGTFTQYYAAQNEVTGIDIDNHALALARARLPIETMQVNVNQERLPFEAETFDAVVAGEVLEHLQFPDLVVAELRRVLKNGGVFVGSVPNSFRLWNRVKFLTGRDFETDPTHLHQFSPLAITKLLAEFSHLEIEYLCSRHLWLSPRLFGTDLVWCCQK